MRTTVIQGAFGFSLLAALVFACSSSSSDSGAVSDGGGSSSSSGTSGSSGGSSSSGTSGSSGGSSSSSGASGSSGGSSSSGTSGSSGTSSSSGTSGSSGSSGSSGDAGNDAGRPTCTNENDEPNEAEATATTLANIDDCDSSGTKLTSVASGTADSDTFRYAGADTAGCIVDPTAQLNVAGAELCMFVACKTGTATVSKCSTGAASATSPSGKPGCCIQTTAPLTTTFACGGSDDSADVYMRVKQLPSNPQSACLPYEVQYHF